jgi:adhesin transport system outer membrane protein
MRISKRILLSRLTISLVMVGVSSHIVHADTLSAVVRNVTQTNPKVLAAKQNRLSIEQAITQARAGYFPQVKATALYGPEHSKNANTIAAAITGAPESVNMPVREVGLTLDQMVFDGYATSGEVLRNVARANSAAYQVLAAMQDSAMNAIQAYLDVLREKELVQLAQNNVNAHHTIMGNIKARVDRGLSNDADYVQVQGRLALADSNLFAEKSNLQDAIARYRLAVGDYPGDLNLPSQVPSYYIPRTEQDAIAYAEINNPVVRSAMADIQAAYQQRQVAKAKNYPRLDLQLGIDRNSNVGGTRGPDDDQFAFAKVSYDLYSGGAIIGRQKETEHLLGQAQEIMRNTYRQAQQDTKFAWDALMTSRSLVKYLKEHVSSSSNTVTAYNDQFGLGKRTLLDLLDVQNETYSAKKSLIEGNYKILVSEFQLLHNMGNLVQAMFIPLPKETYVYVMPRKHYLPPH